MIFNISKDNFEVNEGVVEIKRMGVASKAFIPVGVIDGIIDDINTSGVVVVPSKDDCSIHFEEPTSEEYGVIITNNFGVMLGDRASADIMTMDRSVYIEVYAGKIFFKNEANEVFSLDVDGKVKKCGNSDKIYWIDNAIDYVTNTVGRVLELQYGVNGKDAANNTVMSLDMSVEKDDGHLTFYMKLMNTNVVIGLGEFSMKKGVNTNKFNIIDNNNYFDDDIDDDIDYDIEPEDDEDDVKNNEDGVSVDYEYDYIDDDFDEEEVEVKKQRKRRKRSQSADDTFKYVDDDKQDELVEGKNKLNRIEVFDEVVNEDEDWD